MVHVESYTSPRSIVKKVWVAVLALTLALAVPVLPAQAHDGHEHDAPDSRPDLIVDDLRLSAIPEPGETVQVSFRVANIGQGDVDWYTYVHLATEDYSIYFWDSVYGLEAGANETFTVNWTAPERVHVLTASVDRWDDINETNESNNEATLEVTVGDPKPDLVGWGPLLVPTEVIYGDLEDEFPWRSTIREGDDMTLFAEIGNVGTAPIHEARVQTFLDGTLYDDRVITNDYGYGDFELLVNWTATVGTHTFTVVADPLDAVDEKNETNNEVSLEFTVLTVDEPVPDLAVVAVDHPEHPEVGDRVWFSATIENTGEVAAEAFDTILYVSNVGQSMMSLPGLEPGEQATITVTGDLPIDGRYHDGEIYWAAVVDPFVQYDEDGIEIGGDVAEDNETNNYFVGQLPVRLPDLLISDVRMPGGPFQPGDETIVEVDVTNAGNAGAYASFPVEFIAYDLQTRHVHGLAAGDTVTLTFPVTIDRPYFSGYVRIDSDRAVAESNERNNTERLEELLGTEIGATLEASSDEIWTVEVLTLTARFQNTGELWHPEVFAAFYVDGRYIESGTYGGVDENGEIVATVRWTPLQDDVPPQYGPRNFTVEMHPIWFDDPDWENNTASTIVTVELAPVPV